MTEKVPTARKMPSAFGDCLPLGIYGDTGGGKTTIARQLHTCWDGISIFFNQDEEEEFGYVVRSLAELQQAIEYGQERIDYRIPRTKSRGVEEHEELVEYLMNVGDKLRKSDSRQQIQFLTDEAHEISEQGSKQDSLILITKRGRKRQIKPVSLTQEIQALSNRALNQHQYHVWMSQPGRLSRSHLKSVGFPVEELEAAADYDATLLGKNMEVQGRYRAKERFAVE